MIRSLHKRLSGMSTAAGLAEIDCELAATACDDFTAELMLMKAHYLIASNRKAEAIRLLTDWSERCPHCTGLHYALGEYLVEDRAYVKAVAPLSTAIALISKTGCAWYQDAAYLLRAYCHAKLGDPHKARSDLSHVEDKEGLTWIRADPVISPRSVIQLLTNLKEDN